WPRRSFPGRSRPVYPRPAWEWLTLLVGRPDHDQAAVGPRDRPLDQEEVVVGIDADHVEVADGAALGPVPAGHFLALLGPAAAPVAGQRADAAVRAVDLLGAVAGRQPGEAPALHDAGGAPALGGADHVHRLGVLEDLGHGQPGAHLDVGRPFQP